MNHSSYIHPFYINYEECKSKFAAINFGFNSRFILTMRNVNYQINSFFSNKEIGFILTMRNVNR